MVAEAQDLISDIGDIGVEIGGVGAVAGIGLEKLVPQKDAVLVAEFVEIFAGALPDPVADQVEIGQLVHANLGFEALARDALEGLVEPPVAAADEDWDAVDGDGQIVGAGDGVTDFANAESDVPGIRNVFPGLEAEVQIVEILRTVAIGPPQTGMFDVERGCVLCIEADDLRAVGRQFNLALEGDVFDAAHEYARLRQVADILNRCLNAHVG